MEKTKILEDGIKAMLKIIGEKSGNGLEKTPSRAAEALLFLTQGYEKDLNAVVNGAVFGNSSKNMIVVRGIPFQSLCEHHMLPFFGKIHLAYIPNGKIIGLSKIPRIVEMFSRRLQLQERLTEQVADAVWKVLKPRGVIVLAEAQHLCVMMRGVQKQDVSMLTHCEKSIFAESSKERNDFFNLVANKRFDIPADSFTGTIRNI